MWGRRLGGVLAVIVALAAAVAVLAGRDLSPDVPDAPLVPTRGATRLVSLAPEITEILFALDAGDDLVGRSALCQTPEEALELPAMGTAAAPDLEALRKAGPTRIVVTPVGDETKDQLEGIAPVTVLRLGTPDRLVGAVHVLGRLTGHVAEAVDLATRLTDALTPTVTEASPRVVVALGVDDIAKGEV
ncbi:MAG: ABC transporter substrate-binding protein, partial [Myxococcales bacterium]|nr:ABC transporter substrate-binding protein [Myxococcales bacterium]